MSTTLNVPTLKVISPELQSIQLGRIELHAQTPQMWVEKVISDMDSFLIDHAACEKKASSSALTFVAKYRDRKKLVSQLVDLALEELEHFREVLKVLEKRNIPLGGDESDFYVGELIRFCRHSPQERFLDRLLVSAVIETRGCERFGLLGEALGDSELGNFYTHLSRVEAKHQLLFVQLALEYFEMPQVMGRLQEILKEESRLMLSLPIKARLY